MSRLSITRFPAGFKFGYDAEGQTWEQAVELPKQRIQELEGDWNRLRRLFDLQLWGAPSPGAINDWIGFCRELGGLLPNEVREFLEMRRHRKLELAVTDPLELPWAQLTVESQPLLRDWELSRVHSVGSSTPTRVTRPRALMISNPCGTLPRSSEMAERLVSALSRRMETLHLQGEEANLPRVVEELSKPLTLLLVSAHFERSSLLNNIELADGPLDLQRLKEDLKAPQFAVLNVLPRRAFETSHLAGLFLNQGSETVICPNWGGAGNESIVEGTLRAMAQGTSCAKALRLSRSAWREEAPDDPHLSHQALEVWGQADYRLPLSRESVSTVRTALTPYCILTAWGPRFELDFPLFEQALAGDRFLFIGRPGAQAIHLELPDESLPNRVARIRLQGEDLWLEPLADGLILNGLSLRQESLFQPGDLLCIGENRIRFKSEQESDGESTGGQAKLRVMEGAESERGRELLMTDNHLLVGRGSHCHLQLLDLEVSRVQFILIKRGREYFLSPISSNPTIVNGMAVSREVELDFGAEIRISQSTILRFEREEKPDA